MSWSTVRKIARADILRLAAESGLDVRTVERAVAGGVNMLRAESSRARLVAAIGRLKLTRQWDGRPCER